MKKKFFVAMFALMLCLSLTIPALAAESQPRLVDRADLLNASEERDLLEKLDEISTRQEMDVVVVTIDSLNGVSAMDYADDYFDYNDYAPDGVLLLVSMEAGDWWISTTGYGITAFTDAGIKYIGNQVVPYLSDGKFAEGFSVFADLCDQFLTQAESGDPFDTHNLPKAPFKLLRNMILALVIGLAAAFFATGSMKKKLKSVVQKAQADDYVTPGSLQITKSRDFPLYTHLDRREKPKSGSGSSTHTSSSGTTHGGGGGKF